MQLCKDDTDSMVNILSDQRDTTYVTDIRLSSGENGASRDINVVFRIKMYGFRHLKEGNMHGQMRKILLL